MPGYWTADALIGFAFEGKPQDFDRFRNAPYWRERFGDQNVEKQRFKWTRFYEAIADKLATFRERRDELISGIHAIGEKVDCMSILNDQYQENVPGGPLKDICPFTAMGIFNRGITDANRKTIASELANLLGVTESVPDSFEGIPTKRPGFFGHSYVTPPFGIPIADARKWFQQVVDTEIGPLLDEYWFDELEKSRKARERLLEGF